MSPSGPLYGSTVVAGGDWGSPNNAKVEDGLLADNLNEGPGGGGHSPSQLVVSGFGFSLPATAIIDGIKLEAKVKSDGGGDGFDQDIHLETTGGVSTSIANTPNFGHDWPGSILTWITWGGPTSLWGRAWTVAEINSASFAGSLSAMSTHGTANIYIDSVRITVYWHTAPADVPKRFDYKVFSKLDGSYLGLLPQPSSEFNPSQDINTAGSQITVQVPVSPDISNQPTDGLTTEAGDPLTNESSDPLTTEGQAPIFSPGDSTLSTALISDGNIVEVWETSYWNPNGKRRFIGRIERIEADFGGETGNEFINLLLYSQGQDMSNYLIRGNPYTYTSDVTQINQNNGFLITQDSRLGYNRAGQTWKCGAGVTNLGAISLLLYGTANVTVSVYSNSALTNLLGSATQFVSVGGPTEIQFGFPSVIATVPLSNLFFAVSVDDGQQITAYYLNTNPYANGDMYTASFGGGSGGGAYGLIAGSDLYFKTFSGTGSTVGQFTGQDPTTGMAVPFMTDYIARGGNIGLGTIQATGLSLNVGFNTKTIYEGLQSTLSMCPNGFYYLVDLGTSLLDFKQSHTTADIVLTKGVHLDHLKLILSIENLVNQAFFSGGQVGGSNIYVVAQDATSIALYGPRLARMSDNNIIDAPTARTVAQNNVSNNSSEQHQTTVTIIDKVMDKTLIKPGMTVGFNGFGNFIDNLVLQIVRVADTPEQATLTLGILPTRLVPSVEQIIRQLIAQQTVANPVSPS